MDEVNTVIGNTEKMLASTWVGLNGNLETEPVQVDDIMSVTETAGHLIDGFGSPGSDDKLCGAQQRCLFVNTFV